MIYQEALDYIYSFINKASSKKLLNNESNIHINNTKFLLDKLGYKQTFKVIHITGTKGKGSTTLSLASMIEGVGFNVGAFISPHIINERERISINGNWIDDKSFTLIVESIKNILDNNELKYLPTFFEFFTVIALYYFFINKVDYACIEVGIGGMLDSTNIVKPTACIITSISYDHMDVLGDTLQKIAIQKSGIIKDNVYVITTKQKDEVIEILEKRSKETNSKLYMLGECFFSDVIEDSPSALKFLYTEGDYKKIFNLSLRGSYQAENVALSYKTFRLLFSNEDETFYNNAIKKIEAITINARLTFVSYNPPIIVDGAHNGLSVACVLKIVFSWYDSLIVLFAPLSGKDIISMCYEIKKYKDKMTLIVSSPKLTYKDKDSLKVYEYLKSIGISSVHMENIYEAIDYMKKESLSSNKASLVIGSLYSASNYLLNEKK